MDTGTDGTGAPQPSRCAMSLEPLLSRVRIAARFPHLRVLVRGESGAGKSLVAEAYASAAERKLVQVNCALLEPDRAAADLFGHVRGAYTGADASREGLVQYADGGVLWLDEVHRLPLDAQARLLTWLDTDRYRLVGSNDERVAACAVMCSTNADLRAMALEGTFAHDLLHRIAALEFRVPPLRARPGTAMQIAEDAAGELHLALGPEVRAWVESGDWEWGDLPGNARRLRNAIWQAGMEALSRGEKAIRSAHLGATPVATEMDESEVLRIVRANPGITSADLAESMGIDTSTARRRAKREGCVKRDGRKGGWYPAP